MEVMSWSLTFRVVVCVFLGCGRLTILRRMVAQQGRLPLTLVGVGVDVICYTKEGRAERRKAGKSKYMLTKYHSRPKTA